MYKLQLFVLNILIRRYALGFMVDAWKFFTGYRTQIQLGLAVIIVGLGLVGALPLDTALTIAAAVGGSAFATFLEKLKKHKEFIVEIQKTVEDKSKEQGT